MRMLASRARRSGVFVPAKVDCEAVCSTPKQLGHRLPDVTVEARGVREEQCRTVTPEVVEDDAVTVRERDLDRP